MNFKSTAIGYVFDANGFYDNKYYFENTPENISDFILNNQFSNTTITDVADNLIVTSMMGGFIDRCPDQDYLANTLLPVLIPKQQGEAPINILKFHEQEPGVMICNAQTQTFEQSM